MDERFTQRLADYLAAGEKDWAEGAGLLLQLRRNAYEYQKLMRDPSAHAGYIERELRKFLEYRRAGADHERVMAEVARAEKSVAEAEKTERMHTGKRPDHDTLPDEIKARYEENFNLMGRIRDYHAKMRQVIASSAACKDVDLLPFAREIVKLDKKRLDNWKAYDNYKAD